MVILNRICDLDTRFSPLKILDTLNTVNPTQIVLYNNSTSTVFNNLN